VFVWDASEHVCLLRLQGHTDWPTRLVYSHDGSKLVSGDLVCSPQPPYALSQSHTDCACCSPTRMAHAERARHSASAGDD
jgi:hypothetical protein